MQRLERRRRNRRNLDSLVLEPYRSNVTSQNGEDGNPCAHLRADRHREPMVRRIRRLGRKHHSQHLVRSFAEQGLDANPDRGRAGPVRRTSSSTLRRLPRAHPPRSVASSASSRGHGLMTSWQKPARPNNAISCRSTSTATTGIHQGARCEKFRPRVVVIECNPSIENDIYFVQDYGPSFHHGASMLALVELGKSKGYELGRLDRRKRGLRPARRCSSAFEHRRQFDRCAARHARSANSAVSGL